MVTIRPIDADNEVNRAHVRELIWEFLQWLKARLHEEYGITVDIEAMLAQDMAALEEYLPPKGALLLAVDGGAPIGIAGLHRIAPHVAEVKRMYVRKAFRGRAVGRRLLDGLLEEAKQKGYKAVRLDSAHFMKAARSLYKSAGFREIEPYPESAIPQEFRQHAVFMELNL